MLDISEREYFKLFYFKQTVYTIQTLKGFGPKSAAVQTILKVKKMQFGLGWGSMESCVRIPVPSVVNLGQIFLFMKQFYGCPLNYRQMYIAWRK